MMYEKLLLEADEEKLDVTEEKMLPRNKGFYGDGVIWINRHIPTFTEKGCVLAEELGHYHTSDGEIIDLSEFGNRKQELRARFWAYERLVPLEKLVQAQKEGIRNHFELANYLGVTEDFLKEALKRHKEKHGLFTLVNGIALFFDPLGTLEMFE